MAWIERRSKQWRLMDRVAGIKTVVVKNLGIYKGLANTTLVHYKEAVTMGFTFTPPIPVSDIEDYLRSKREGVDPTNMGRRITIEEMIAIYTKHHGPSLKGGVDMTWGSPYYNFVKRLVIFQRFWAGKYVDEFHKYDIRDFLAAPLEVPRYKKGETLTEPPKLKSIGTQMKYLGTLSHMFGCFYEWNEENVLGYQVKLPKHNPGKKWRKEMKTGQKMETPDTRVLSQEEWLKFRAHLKPTTLAICEAALFRVQRKADIRGRAPRQVSDGFVQGLQAKTGQPYRIPVLMNHPEKYDFKNFNRDFLAAQKAAGMDWPASDPRHFTLKDLRRTGAMWAYRATLDLAGVSAMLGHTEYKTTKKYLNITQADTQAITDKLDKLAGGPIFGREEDK